MSREQKSVCPWCGYRADMASAVVSKAESASLTEEPHVDSADGNSVSFCIACGESAIFDASAPGGLRFPSLDEALNILTLAEIQHVSLAWGRSLDRLGESPRTIRNKPEWMK